MRFNGLSRRILCAVLSVLLLLPTVAYAAVAENGGTGDTLVYVTGDAAMFSVTVPTGLPVHVDADGGITVATDARIINDSPAPVRVKGVSVTGTDPWQLVDWGESFVSKPVDSMDFALSIQGAGVGAGGSCDASFAAIPAKDSIGLMYNAKAAPRRSPVSASDIAKVVFTVGWDVTDVGSDPSNSVFVSNMPSRIGEREYFTVSLGGLSQVDGRDSIFFTIDGVDGGVCYSLIEPGFLRKTYDTVLFNGIRCFDFKTDYCAEYDSNNDIYSFVLCVANLPRNHYDRPYVIRIRTMDSCIASIEADMFGDMAGW